MPTFFIPLLFVLSFFIGAGVGKVDGVVDGDGDGTLVFFDPFTSFFLSFFTGAGVGKVDGVVDGDGDGTFVFFIPFSPLTTFTTIVGDGTETGTAVGASLHAFSQPQATRKAGKSNN